jgi:AbrB family looped-hinge helix DNA binding protein
MTRENRMTTVTVSPRFQVVIPERIREGLEVGQELQVIQYLDRIELIPVKPLRSMRGFLEGIDCTMPRAEDRV